MRPPMSPITGTLRIQDIPKPIYGPPDETHLPNFTDVDYSALYKSEEGHATLHLLSIYDQLSLAPLWWMLEVWPMKQHTKNLITRGSRIWASAWAAGGSSRSKRGMVSRFIGAIKMKMEALHSNGTKFEKVTCSRKGSMGVICNDSSLSPYFLKP
ncbi:hypothetical protein PTI98_010458 [Pleurotus ostreatus]|nr:hypothetical protein PTI98_010458 [Pleurotus ostreatus]